MTTDNGSAVNETPDEANETPDEDVLPAIPVSAGALIFDRSGRLLILKPTYKSGWTIPGGIMEADGETPWDACRLTASVPWIVHPGMYLERYQPVPTASESPST